jgi:hypothetical protein
VVQRMTSLSALFLLAAMWLHIQGRESRGRIGATKLLLAWGLLWPLSCLSKETGFLFPLLVLAWELTVRRASRGYLDTWARVYTVVAGLVFVAVASYLLSDKGQWLWAGYVSRPFTMTERLMTDGRVLWFYLGLIFVPRLSAFGLYHDDISVSADWFTPWTTAPAVIGLLGLLTLIWFLRKRAPLIAFGMAWFFIGHALESTVLPLEIAHEHRNYLPLLGVLLVLAGLALEWTHAPSVARRYLVPGALALMLALAAVTALRSQQFGDEVRRTQLAVQYHPQSTQTQYEAGQILDSLISTGTGSEAKLYSLAQQHYGQANTLSPYFKSGLFGLIHLACKTGHAPDVKDLATLAQRLQYTPFGPADRNVLYALKQTTIAYAKCLRRTEVEALFIAALGNPGVTPGVQAMLWSWLADYQWLVTKDLSAAKSALARSLTLNPGNASNRLKWAQLLFIAGERPAAYQGLLALRGELLSSEERRLMEELLKASTMSDY